jgi:hypothetical protein
MRAPLKILALAALAAVAACHEKQAPANVAAVPPVAAAPAPTPGLWIERVSDSHGAQVTKICLDAAAATSFAALNTSLTGNCSRHDMAQAADGTWHFSTSCDMGQGGQVATEGVVSGDFTSHYTIEARSQTVNAVQSAANGPGRVSADIRRAGDCPADMKPGDVVLPNGARTNLSSLPQHA